MLKFLNTIKKLEAESEFQQHIASKKLHIIRALKERLGDADFEKPILVSVPDNMGQEIIKFANDLGLKQIEYGGAVKVGGNTIALVLSDNKQGE